MSDVQLSFVLLSEATSPNPDLVVQSAAAFGIGLTVTPGDDISQMYELDGGGSLIVALMPGPHPDAANMAHGISSPDPDELGQMVAHYIVTIFGREPVVDPDIELAQLTSAVMTASPAIAGMIGRGAAFHKAGFFTAAVTAAEGEIPIDVTVDITVAPEGEGRMSFLTHGLKHYEREEFYVTSSVDGQGALEYIRLMTRWMIMDRDKHLPTGDTVGRTAEEKIVVQRVSNPTGSDDEVIRLDLDMDDHLTGAAAGPRPNAGPTKKSKRWFNR